MDYGKLAYLRLDELENAMSSAKTGRVKSTGFSACPDYPLRGGNDYYLASAVGEGCLTLVITLAADVSNPGRVSLYADGEKAGFADFPAAAEAERTLLVTLRIGGAGKLTLCAENGFSGYLKALSVAVIGENAVISRQNADFAADDSEEYSAVIRSQNDRVSVCRGQVTPQGFSYTETAVGSGGTADIAGDGQGGFYAVYSDNFNNLWLTHLSGPGGGKRIRLGDGADSAAVCNTGRNLTVAWTRGEKVYYCTAGYGPGSLSQERLLETDTGIDRVAFVKGASAPVLVLTAKGKIFARFAAAFSASTQAVSEIFTAAFGALIEDV